MSKHKWIAGAIKHPGALHRQLGVPAGNTIPLGRLKSAANSDNPTLARRARLAMTLRKMNPWEVIKEGDGWWVVREGTREKVHKTAHKSREEAMAHVRALYAAEGIDQADKMVKTNKARRDEPKPSPSSY